MSLIRELIEKHAALKEDVKLRDHQEKAVNITGNRVNFAHPVGSGKTLTSIAKFEKLKEQGEAGKALVIVPSSLRDNFAAKGVEKFTDSTYNVVGTKDEVRKGLAHNPTPDADYNIVSYEIFRRDPEFFLKSTGADTVILDENHRTKNEDTMTAKSFDNELYRQQVKNFIGLTGSITSNTPADMVPLVNIASKGEANIGKNKNEFLDRYAIRDNSKVYKGYAENRKPIVGFRNRQQLQSELGKYIHFMGDDEIKEIANMPDKDLDVTYVPISKEQKKLYQKMLRDDPEMRKLITRKRFDTLKDEEISRAYSQLIEMRKLMNDPSSVIAKGEKGSPKLDKMIDDLEAHLNSTPDGQALLFSHLINGGVSSIEEELLERGLAYDKFIGKGNNGVTEQSRQQAVRDYNDRKNRILLISSAGGEGISLDDTTFEGVLDPHFNPERMNQMEARGIRSGGLSHRPDGERVVDVNRYLATMPKTLGIFKSPVLTPDEMIYRIAQNKERQNKIVHDMLKNVRAQQEKDYMRKQAADEASLGERADELYEDRILPYAKNYVTGSLPGQAIGIGGALALLRTQKGKAFSDSLKQSVKNPLLRVLVKGGLLGVGSSIGSSIGRGTSRGLALNNTFEDQLGRTPTLSEYGKSVPVAMIPFVGGAIATPEAMARKIKEGEIKMAGTLIGELIEKMAGDGYEGDITLDVATGLAGSALIAKSSDSLLGRKQLYHGTSKENASKIKREGLNPEMGGSGGASDKVSNSLARDKFKNNSKGYVHVTGREPIARMFANFDGSDFAKMPNVGKITNPDGEVLKLKIPYNDFKNMIPDEDIVPGLFGMDSDIAKALVKELGAKSDKTISAKYIKGSGEYHKGALDAIKRLPEYISENPRRFGVGAAGSTAGLAALLSLVKDGDSDDSVEKRAYEEAIEKALATDLEKKVAQMMATSHEYKKPNIQGALTFVKNYAWEERMIPLSRLQGINKPIKQEKVFEIARTLEQNGDKVDWPFIVVNKIHGIKPQTHSKAILLDGHHRAEACKARGIKEVPVYFGTYTGGAEIDDEELYKEVPNEKTASEEIPRGVFKDQCSKGNHSFKYYGGEARCVKCGWFVSPSGKLSKIASAESFREYKIEASPEVLDKIERIISTAKSLGDMGSSRWVEFAFDGDGSDRISSFKRTDSKEKVQTYDGEIGGGPVKVSSERDLLEKTAEEIIEKKIVTQDDLYTVARIVHEINRHYNKLLMDREDPSWDELDERDKANRISLLSETVPDIKKISAKKMHDMWVAQQEKEGWAYGEKYDKRKKTHPCIVSWSDLPELEKAKDAMYLAVIKSMTELHFGIDKTISDKIKEVEIPGGEKVLMNKSATLIRQLIEKQASARSEKRKAIEQTLFGSDPSGRFERLSDEMAYKGGYEESSDDFYEALDNQYDKNMKELLSNRPDLTELARVSEEQRKKSGQSYVGKATLPLGFVAGAGAGVYLPVKGIRNSLEAGKVLPAALKTLALPVTGGLGLVGGSLGGLVAGGAVGELFDTPIRAARYLKDKDYAAYDNFTDAQANEIARARAEAMARAERETEDLLLPKRATLVGQLIEKQANYLKDFVAGMDPTGVAVFRRGMENEDNHGAHKAVADASGFISGAVTGGAIPGVLLGGASLAMKKKNPHLADELRIMAGGALDTYNPKRVGKYIKSFKELGKFKTVGRELMDTSKAVTNRIDAISGAKSFDEIGNLSGIHEDYAKLRKAQGDMDELTAKMRKEYFDGKSVDEGMSRAMSAVTGIGMAGVAGGINAGSSHLQYNAALEEKEKQRKALLKQATLVGQLIEKQALIADSEEKDKFILGGAGTIGGLAIANAQVDKGHLTGRELLYHGTPQKNVKSILENGIIAPKDVLGEKSVTKAMVEARGLSESDFLNKTYMGRRADVASGVAQKGVLDEFLRQLSDTEPSTPGDFFKAFSRAHESTKPALVKGRLPVWMMKTVENPELAGAKSGDEFARMLAGDAVDIPFFGAALKNQGKASYDMLSEKGTYTFEGDIPAKYLKGKNYERQGMEELISYIKANPKRFSKGLASALAGSAVAGLGAKTVYDNRDAFREEKEE